MIKIKSLLPALVGFFLVSCASLQKKDDVMAPLYRLIELEDLAGAGIQYRFKDGVSQVTEYSSPEFGDWTLIILPGPSEKMMLSDVFKSFMAGPGVRPPVIMTMDEYVETLLKEPRPEPGPMPGNYATVEQRIAMMRDALNKHPALIHIYKHEPAE